MSLATRCPVCQTVFRVVQDQLKVSEGWVRCGRCAKVFNAFEGLFDLEREFPALRSTPGSATPSQKVLEDLARRNPRPQHTAQWEQESDTRAGVRDASPPTAPPLTRPPMQPAAPVTGAPLAAPVPFKNSGPAPFKPSAPAPFKPSAPAPFRPSAPAPFKHSTPAPLQAASAAPFKPSVPAPVQDSATAPAFAARSEAPAVSAPRTPRAPLAAPDDATIAPVTALLPPAGQTAASPVGTPLAPPRTPSPVAAAPAALATLPPARKPAAALSDVDIRDEPTPVVSSPQAGDTEEDDSFEALFRSDGEMAASAADEEGVDIVLDGSDVEPASLDPDDAVDSRLLTFVQQADKAERWRRPWVRGAMALCALVLTLLLAAQILVVRRDAVVASWPDSRSLVQALCAPFDCRIEPLRRIEHISVDSSGLTRIDDGPVYRLALVLRNRADTPLLTPAIDLSLTDASGTLVTRRMLSATELGASRTTIAAGQELPLQALLMSADRPLTGYTIEIFYP